MKWFIAVMLRYAQFSGRAQRAEFWWFMLVSVLILLGLTLIDVKLSGVSDSSDLGLLGTLFYLVILVPSLAVGARRLHDTGRSGWWQLLVLLPVVGSLALLVLFALDSTPGSNRYGPNPKGIEV